MTLSPVRTPLRRLFALVRLAAAGVLLARVTAVSQSVQVTPDMYMGPPVGYGYSGFYGYYGGMWASSYYSPPSIYAQDNVVADTQRFEARSFALFWSASTTTPGAQGTAGLLEQFATHIATTLAGDGLI